MTLAAQYQAAVSKSKTLNVYCDKIRVIGDDDVAYAFDGFMTCYIVQREGRFVHVFETLEEDLPTIEVKDFANFATLEDLVLEQIQYLRCFSEHNVDFGEGDERFELMVQPSIEGPGVVWEARDVAGETLARGGLKLGDVELYSSAPGVETDALMDFLKVELIRTDV